MTHLDEADIARFAEGHVSESEHERFIMHLAKCEDCLKAVADTLTFLEEERRRNRSIMKLLNLKNKTTHRDIQPSGSFYRTRKFVLAMAALVIILVLLPLLFVKKIPENTKSNVAKIQYIEESIMKREGAVSYGFAKSRDSLKAAIRAGFFIEDLNIIINVTHTEKLRAKVYKMLSDELEIVLKEAGTPSPELEKIEKRDFKRIVNDVQDIMKQRSLFKAYQFGRFVERSILETFENRLPKQKDIERYLMIAQQYEFPQGVITNLENVQISAGPIENRKIWEKIKEIF